MRQKTILPIGVGSGGKVSNLMETHCLFEKAP